MEIKSLGDLVLKTEAELLSYKNFGETSLAEIKAILESKNLSLGMDPEKIESKSKRMDLQKLFHAGGEDVRMKPIAELGLSIRARKCMDLLNVRSIGDLADKTENDLLRCKNFGLTSLMDVKQKLAQFGVELRKE
jgi:DNA-directed RNA polymerase subunit alpha